MDEKSESRFENKPAESEQLRRINQQLESANQQLAAAQQQLRAEGQQLRAANQQLRAAHQQLKVEEQQLRAASQQLRAANQQLKITEEKLRETNQTLQAVIQASPLPIFTMDREQIVKAWNPAAERTFGWTAQEVIGHQYPAIPEEKKDEADTMFSRALESGLVEVETLRQRKDGSLIDVSISAAPLRDSRDNINGVMAVLVDITERKRAENRLRDSRHMLQTVLDSIPAAVFWKDRDSIYLGGNRTFLEAAGLESSEEVVGKSDYDLPWGKKQSDLFREDDRRVMESGIPEYGIIEPYIRADGTYAWANTNKVPLRDTKGNIVGILGTYEDITERKKAEEVLREQKEILQTILDNIPVMIAFLDSNGNHKWVNQAWQKTLGWSLKEAQSRDVLKEFYPDTQNYQHVVGFISKAESNWDDFRTRRRDRTVLETTWINVPLSDGSNIGIGLDITERKQAHDALQEAHDELEQRVEERTAQLLEANRQLQKETAERMRKEEMLRESERLAAVGSLAAKIAHEINNPLAGIKNSFLLIKDSIPDNHPYYKYVGLIEKEIERVSDIVSQMYDLYRPVVQAQKRRFSLHEAVADVVALLKVASEEHKVDVSIDIDQSIIVRLPDSLLRQVLFNIIQNAIEASHPDSKVRVTGEIREGILDMRIIDTGVGISKDIRNRIFEPFFTSKRDSAKRSLGLGLSVCKNIVNAIGGEVTVQSRAGKGTTFAIKIPFEGNNAKQDNK